MKRTIRLTEADLTRIVKRVIKEQSEMKSKGILGHNDSWYDEDDNSVNPDDFDFDEEIEFGPDDFEEYISHTEKHHPENRWSFGDKGYKGDRTPGKGYYDRYQKHGPIKLRRKH